MSLELSGNPYLYFPYSIGVVWCYANNDDIVKQNYELIDIFFRKEPIDTLLDKIVDPDVLALSGYVWNGMYNKELAKRVKQKYPNCTIVFGGPDVPDNDDEYFIKNPYVDYTVHQEGEISFTGILKHLVGEQDKDLIPGISYNLNSKRVTTGPSHRVTDLTGIPSPYTSGLFDNVLKTAREKGFTMQGVMETNRGCPFQCTFCDWGGVTFSKVKVFDISRIKSEIEWFAKNQIEYVHITDANFGIYKDRDNAIADLFIKIKKEYGFPKVFDSAWAKNSNDTVVDIAKKLMDAGMARRFTASLQSMNSKTLDAIKRVNLNGNQLENIIYEARDRGLHLTTELILGLPEETYESWLEGVGYLLENDFIIESFPLTVFANSEMRQQDYVKQYGLEIERTKTYFSKYVDEYQDMVVGTKTLPPKVFKRLWLWTFFTIMLHQYGFTNLIGKYLNKRHKISPSVFYEKLLDYGLSHTDYPLHQYLEKWKKYADDKEYQWFTQGYVQKDMINDIGITNRKKFYYHLTQVCKSMIDDPLIDDVIKLQEIAQSTFEHDVTSEIEFDANLYEYIEHNKDFTNNNTQYKVEQSRISHPTWFDFMTFARKNGNWRAKFTAIN